jgi:hypothetical protein
MAWFYFTPERMHSDIADKLFFAHSTLTLLCVLCGASFIAYKVGRARQCFAGVAHIERSCLFALFFAALCVIAGALGSVGQCVDAS